MDEQQDQDRSPSLTLRRVVSGPCNIEAGASAWASACEPHSATHPIPRIIAAVQDRINVLDHRWQLVDSLPFELAFPSQTHLESLVHAVAFDAHSCRIASSSHGRVAVWHKPTARSAWKIHSSFVAPCSVHALDFRRSRIVAAGDSLSLWVLDEGSALPRSASRIVMAKLSPSSDLLATVEQLCCQTLTYEKDNRTQTRFRLQRIPLIAAAHPRLATKRRCFRVSELACDNAIENEPSFALITIGLDDNLRRSEPILFTETIDGVFRIWGCVIDEPDRFSLWASLDVASGLNQRVPLMTKRLRGHLMVHDTTSEARGREFSTTDEFLVVFTDGSAASMLVEVSAELAQSRWEHTGLLRADISRPLQNFNARPPACLVQSAGAISGVAFAAEDLPCLRYAMLLNISDTQCVVVGRNTRGVVVTSGVVSFLDTHSFMGHSRSTKPPVNMVGCVSRLLTTLDGNTTIACGSAKRVQTWTYFLPGHDSKSIIADIQRVSVGHCVAWHAGGKRLRVAVLDTERLRVYDLGPGVRSRLLAEHGVLSAAPFSSFVVAQSGCNAERVSLHALSRDLNLYSWIVEGCNICSASPVPVASKWRTLPRIKFLTSSTNSPGPGVPSEHKIVLFDGKGTLVVLKALLSPAGPVQWLEEAQYSVSQSQPTAAAVSPTGVVALVSPSTPRNPGEPSSFELSFLDERSVDPWSFQRFEAYKNDTRVHLSWSYDGQILAAGSSFRVRLFGAQRIDANGNRSGWGEVASIEVELSLRGQISDMCWSARKLVLSSRDHLCFYDLTLTTGEALLDKVETGSNPLPLSHPQLLHQALLQGRFEAVTSILAGLASHLNEDERVAESVPAAPAELLLHKLFMPDRSKGNLSTRNAATGLLSSLTFRGAATRSACASMLTEEALGRILAAARARALNGLTDSEHEALALVARTTYLVGNRLCLSAFTKDVIDASFHCCYQVQGKQRTLDLNGLRYLVALQSFTLKRETVPRNSDSLDRLANRYVIPAFHSECQTVLVEETGRIIGGTKLNWTTAKALGMFMWIRDRELLTTQMEVVGRTEYMNPNQADKDPITAMLFFLAIGKKSAVTTLWRQASGNADQNTVLKFLSNDFELARWKTAARKNAFALLSKRRFGERSAIAGLAFFLLGDSLKDAVNVCLRQLDDFQLAVAISRAYEGDCGPVLKEVMELTVIPLAMRLHSRWLVSWAFWMMSDRQMAAYALVLPFGDLFQRTSMTYTAPKVASYNDPYLAVLYQQIREPQKVLENSQDVVSESDFVLRMARNLRRMGCHLLALDLVRNYSFAGQSALSPSKLRIATDRAFDAQCLALKGSDHGRPGVANDVQARKLVTGSSSTSEVVTPLPGKTRKIVVAAPEFDMSAFF
ncbi:BQ5605_C041g11961 [Microbotryum silenes-dioicae]|uniref:BQ5605_C041g11961 protein n=1 Tax=Microbotryum silenes-dioicae TaxID=796604 RepID=A0A2X0NCJ5_9BASI|nr:BQ5605_C041g11961 [Microbotryum silenes-dioicae]